MKKNYLLLFAAVLLAATGCKKTKVTQIANVDQDISYQEEIAFPFGAGSQQFPLPFSVDTSVTYALATGYQAYLAQYNTSSDKVIHARMKKLTWRITAPATQYFDFLDSVKVYVRAGNLPEVLAAYKVPVPKTQQQLLDFDIVDQDLKPYFLNDSMYIRLNGSVNAIPQTGTNLNLSTTFNLLANPLN